MKLDQLLNTPIFEASEIKKAPKVVVLSYNRTYNEIVVMIGKKKYQYFGVSPYQYEKMLHMAKKGANRKVIEMLGKHKFERLEREGMTQQTFKF